MKYLIDVGSSTVKIYTHDGVRVKLIKAKTFDFKDEFDSAIGLSSLNKENMYSFFNETIEELSLTRSNTKLFATGIFRELTNKQAFIEEFYTMTRLFFNIVSHELEAFYLEKAWIGNCDYKNKLVIINIGGKTTELIFYNNGFVTERKMLSLGVGTILKKYNAINEEYSPTPLSEVVEYISNMLPFVDRRYDTAIYTGGELTYMNVAGYYLEKNNIFDDENHPSMITIDNYCIQNKRIFSEITIADLRNMMPNNPAWMNGARACSAIAQAICMQYGINKIIPSDSNLIDGINVQEVKNVVICGSFNKQLDKITKLIGVLKTQGITVDSPLNTEVVGSEKGFILFKNDKIINRCTWSVEALHLKAIETCDMIIVCNFDKYVGTKTSLEIGYAYKCGKKIVFLYDNETVDDFDIPSEIGLLRETNLNEGE